MVRTKLWPVRPKSHERADDPAHAAPLLSGELGAAVGGERCSRVGLEVRLALGAVEDVVGGEVDDGSAERGDVARALDVRAEGAARRPRRRRRRSRRPHGGRGRYGRRRRRVTSSSDRVRASAYGNASRSAAPSWPPAPVIRTRGVALGQDRSVGAPQMLDAGIVPRNALLVGIGGVVLRVTW